eukprot:403368727
MISQECLHRSCQNCIETKFLKNEAGTICFQCKGVTQPDKYKLDPDTQQALEAFSLLPILCENHPNSTADVLCLQCDVLSCKKCAKSEHQGHNINKEKLTPDIFNEYLANAQEMLEQQKISIQALLLQINDMQENENENEIKSSEFMILYNQVKTLLSSLIPDKKQLLKLDFKNYKMIDKLQPQENGKKVEIISKVYERQLQNIQSEMYLQFTNLVNLELNKDQQCLLMTARIENYQNKNFKLLYQGSRDGYKINSIEKLYNQGPTVWFILSEFGQVFGGYTSITWKKNQASCDDVKAFIFQLNKRTIHKQYQNQQSAIHQSNNSYLCVFGGQSGDAFIQYDCDINTKSYCELGGTYLPPNGYQLGSNEAKSYLAGQRNFKVIEIEVYSFN